MGCREAVLLSELKAEVDFGGLSDAVLQSILDRIQGKIESMVMGHSFGRAIRIYHDGSSGVTVATVQVTATGVVLHTETVTGPNADVTLLFAAYPQIGDLVGAIDGLSGWVAELVETVPYDMPSSLLNPLAATNALRLCGRLVLCLSAWKECSDGNNEHMWFPKMPIRSVVTVYEDGLLLNPGTAYAIKSRWLERLYATGGSCCCYRLGYWSCAGPCNVCVTYVPTWWGMNPSMLRNAIIALAGYEIADAINGAYQGESIGDYSYTKGNVAQAWAFWTGPLGIWAWGVMP